MYILYHKIHTFLASLNINKQFYMGCPNLHFHQQYVGTSFVLYVIIFNFSYFDMCGILCFLNELATFLALHIT